MRKLLTVLAVVIAMIAVVPISLHHNVPLNYTDMSLVSGDNEGNFITTIATSTYNFISNVSISLTPTAAYAWMPPGSCLEALGGCWSCWTMCLWEIANIDFFDEVIGHNW